MTVEVYRKDGTKVEDLSKVKVPIEIQKELFEKVFSEKEKAK